MLLTVKPMDAGRTQVCKWVFAVTKNGRFHLVLRVELITGRREGTFLVTCRCKGPGPCRTVFQVWTVGEVDGKKIS